MLCKNYTQQIYVIEKIARANMLDENLLCAKTFAVICTEASGEGPQCKSNGREKSQQCSLSGASSFCHLQIFFARDCKLFSHQDRNLTHSNVLHGLELMCVRCDIHNSRISQCESNLNMSEGLLRSFIIRLVLWTSNEMKFHPPSKWFTIQFYLFISISSSMCSNWV